MRERTSREKWGWLLGVIIAALSLPIPKAHADLVFQDKIVKAGKIKSGPILSRTFRFQNTGKRPIRIVGTRTGCKCVIPKSAKKTYAPGEKGTIDLQVETLSSASGEKRWVAYIQYQEGSDTKTAAVELHATLETEVSVQPARVAMRVRSSFKQKFVLYDKRTKPLKVVAVECTSPHLKARRVSSRSKQDGQWTTPVELEVTRALPDGTHREYLVLYTDDVEYRELKVPVSIIKGVSRATVTPSRLRVALSRTKPVAPSVLIVRSPDASQKVKIKDVLTNHPAVRCQWDSAAKTVTKVRLTVDPKQLTSGGFQTSVQIILSEPSSSVLTVRVRGFLSD